MGFIDAAVHDSKLLGWALLFSVGWGAIAGLIMGVVGHDPGMPWYGAMAGGAAIGPLLTVVFETPLRKLVLIVNQFPYVGWAIVLPFALMRYMFSWPAVMMANAMMAARDRRCPELRPERFCHPGQRQVSQVPRDRQGEGQWRRSRTRHV